MLWLRSHNRYDPSDDRVVYVTEASWRAVLLALVDWLGQFSQEMVVITFCILFIVSPGVAEAICTTSIFTYTLIVYPWAREGYYSFLLRFFELILLVKCTLYLFNAPRCGSSKVEFNTTVESYFLGPLTVMDFLAVLVLQVHIHNTKALGMFAFKYHESDTWYGKFVDEYHHVRKSLAGGVDHYTKYLLCDVFSFLLIAFSYFALVGVGQGDIVQSIRQNLLPGPLVVISMTCVLIGVVDRVLYLIRSNTCKLIFHILITITYHVLYSLWYHTLDSDGQAVFLAGVVFSLKCIYLFISCAQIKYGFKRLPQHDPFTVAVDFQYYISYYIYRAIPFVWELRNLLDWTCTSTTLKFSYWLKLEDIYHEIYLRRIDVADTLWTNPTRGKRYPWYVKFYVGFLGFVVLMFILFFPLLFYSTFNPATTTNNLNSIAVQVGFEGSAPFFQDQIGMFGQTSLSSNALAQVSLTRPHLSEYDIINSFKTNQLFSFGNCSGQVWTVTPPARKKLLNTLRSNDSISIVTVLTTSRAVQDTTSSTDMALQFRWPNDGTGIPPTVRHRLADLINRTSKESKVTLQNFYTPFVMNQPSDIVSLPTLDKPYNMQDCDLTIESWEGTTDYWCMSCNSLFIKGNTPTEYFGHNISNYELQPGAFTRLPMYYLVVSDKVPAINMLIPNIGIIALYTTFILAIGRLIRSGLTGSAHNVVLQDMHDPTILHEFVQYIFLARLNDDFELEEKLYFELIDLLRSPESLLEVTGERKKTYNEDGQSP